MVRRAPGILAAPRDSAPLSLCSASSLCTRSAAAIPSRPGSSSGLASVSLCSACAPSSDLHVIRQTPIVVAGYLIAVGLLAALLVLAHPRPRREGMVRPRALFLPARRLREARTHRVPREIFLAPASGDTARAAPYPFRRVRRRHHPARPCAAGHGHGGHPFVRLVRHGARLRHLKKNTSLSSRFSAS